MQGQGRLLDARLLLTLVALLGGGCAGAAEPPAPAPRPAPAAPTAVAPMATAPSDRLPGPAPDAKTRTLTLREAGLDPDAIDRAVSPCDDLYRHACGKWVDGFAIAPDKVTFEKTFSAGSDRTRERLRAILEAIPDGTETPREKQVRSFYRACMDEEAIEARGTQPLDRWLRRVREARTRDALAQVIGEVHPLIDVLFRFGAIGTSAPGQPVVARWSPGGTRGLVDLRDLFEMGEARIAQRTAYTAHATRMLRLAGLPEAEARKIAVDAVRIQADLARAAWPRGSKVTVSIAELEALTRPPGGAARSRPTPGSTSRATT